MLESAFLSLTLSNPSVTVGDCRSWIELGSADISMRFTDQSRDSVESSAWSVLKSPIGNKDIRNNPINATAILCPINQPPIASPFSIRVVCTSNNSRPKVVSKEVHRCLIGKHLHSPTPYIVGPSFVIFCTTIGII